MAWDEKDVELLKKEWARGKSAGEISRLLLSRYSRSAVLGMVHRLGMQRKVMPDRIFDSSIRQRRARRTKKENPWNHIAQPKKPAKARPVLEPDGFVPPVVNETPTRTLVTLERGECRWPIGDPKLPDFGFCGCKAVPGQSYCEGHAARAYVGAPKPQRIPLDETVPAESVRQREGVS